MSGGPGVGRGPGPRSDRLLESWSRLMAASPSADPVSVGVPVPSGMRTSPSSVALVMLDDDRPWWPGRAAMTSRDVESYHPDGLYVRLLSPTCRWPRSGGGPLAAGSLRCGARSAPCPCAGEKRAGGPRCPVSPQRHPRWLARRHPKGCRDRQRRSERAWSGTARYAPPCPGVPPSAGAARDRHRRSERRVVRHGSVRPSMYLTRRYPDRCDRPPPPGTGPSQVGGRRPHAVISGAVARSIGRCATFARCSAISCSVARLAAKSRSRICSTVARSSTAHAGPVIGK